MKALLALLGLAFAAGAAHAQQRGERWDGAEGSKPPAEQREAPRKTPISVADKEKVAPVVLARLRTTILNNQILGPREEGMFCRAQGNIIMGPKTWEAAARGAARAFRTELMLAGHPNPYATESAFDDNRKPETDFEVGATVRQVKLKLCISGREAQGSLWVETRWELYSKKARKVVFSAVTEGSYENAQMEALGFSDWWERAFSVAVRSLLAEPQFAAFLTGAAPLPVAEAAPGPASDRILLPITPALDGGVTQNATLLRASVVTVVSGKSTGSGFFVSPEGYLITNQHVVGDAKFVKIQLATGRELVGEVLRIDRARDVALVKTERIGATTLSIRTSEPNIGEELYAIGSPFGDRFSGSLTRGILSGHRVLGEQRYLQSDVTVLPGNSGGPLLDASGKVVGISKGGLVSGRGNLNLFIPIGDALSTLSLQLQQ